MHRYRAFAADCAAGAFGLGAYSIGPDPGRTGGPGDSGNCAAGSCHLGAPERGTGAVLHFPNGPFYRPGVTQRLLVHAWGAGTETGRAAFGYQLSARLAADPETQAGSSAVDERSFVQCRKWKPEAVGRMSAWGGARVHSTSPAAPGARLERRLDACRREPGSRLMVLQ